MRNSIREQRRPTPLELTLGNDRTPRVILLILLPLVCWSWIIVMARDMYGPMNGAGAWMMTLRWDAWHTFLLWAMWAVMMTGMMLPSASPMLVLYGAAARHRGLSQRAALEIYALAMGYVAVWAVFSCVATFAQRALSTRLILTPMMTLATPALGGALLLVAGLYQLTPLKRACLQKCQTPFAFLLSHWHAGVAGAFRMGVEHGTACLGCCWALMLLLFVGGVMNLVVIAALTIFVAFEKLGRFGVRGARISGALLMAAGLWMFVRR